MTSSSSVWLCKNINQTRNEIFSWSSPCWIIIEQLKALQQWWKVTKTFTQVLPLSAILRYSFHYNSEANTVLFTPIYLFDNFNCSLIMQNIINSINYRLRQYLIDPKFFLNHKPHQKINYSYVVLTLKWWHINASLIHFNPIWNMQFCINLLFVL